MRRITTVWDWHVQRWSGNGGGDEPDHPQKRRSLGKEPTRPETIGIGILMCITGGAMAICGCLISRPPLTLAGATIFGLGILAICGSEPGDNSLLERIFRPRAVPEKNTE